MRVYNPIILFILSVALMMSCKKSHDNELLIIDDLNADPFGTIDYEARAENFDFENIEMMGICWSKTKALPDVTDEIKTTSFKTKPNFGAKIKGFEFNTKYFFRAFIIGEEGSIYYSAVQEHHFGPGWRDVGKPETNFSIEDISFVDNLNGYISGKKSSTAYMYKTDDGGLNWSMVSYNSDLTTYKIHFLSDDRGYRICRHASMNRLQRTDNGGASWYNISYGESGLLEDLYCWDENRIYIATEENYIKMSGNAGNTWVQSVLLELHETDRVVDFDFIDVYNGFLLTKNGNIYKTNDVGISWELFSPLIVPDAKDLEFLNENEAILLSKYKIFKSYDGGLTWNEKYELTHDSDQFKKVDFANNLVGGVTGTKNFDGGFVFMTKDGGESWDEQWWLGLSAFNIQFLSPTQGYVHTNKVFRYH